MAREPQSDIAWNNFLGQHKQDENAETFVKPFYAPLNILAQSADDLYEPNEIDVATGERLDLIGSIVGASRVMPQGIKLVYFGFISQEGGRGFGKARMRSESEPMTESYTAPDTEYRTLIRAKIALNNGHGTAPEIEEAAKTAFRAPTVSARNSGPGAIELWVGRIPGVDEGLGRVIPDILPKAAGVKISIVFWSPNLPFGFSNNKHFGFGVGIMSRSPLS